MNFEKLKIDLMSEINLKVVEKLYLDKHRIVKINENAFNGFSSLSELYLSRNILKLLDERIFNGLSQLTILDLSLNQLTRINENTFKDLRSLRKLDLSGNQLTYIGEKTFHGLLNLEELYISRNKLKSIDENAFRNLKNLNVLYLFDNQLSRLNENVFQGLDELKELDLSFNGLILIKENTFKGLKNLVKLYLFLNNLNKIPKDAFHGLSNLQLLYLSRNKITYLDESTFNGLCNLQTLDLSHNLIKSIHHSTFNDLKNLSELYLFDNKFESVNSDLFFYLKKLNELCLFDQNIIYCPKISINNYEINKLNLNLIVGKTFRNNKIETEYIIKNNSLNWIKLVGKKWRNFQSNFEWRNISPKLSILIGSNGIGKTNCLKLIYSSLNQTNKISYDTSKYFVCKYFAIENFYSREYLISEFEKFDSSLKNIKIAKNFTEYLYDSINYFCLIQYFDYLILIGCDIKVINKHLDKNGFQYTFSENKFKERQNQQIVFLKDIFKSDGYFLDKLNTDIEYYLNKNGENENLKLSHGEHFKLLILLWQIHASKKDQENIVNDEYGIKYHLPINTKLRIMLLDQPDYFMDHSLFKEFYDLILSDKFSYLNYQIIMSTQNLACITFIDHNYLYSISRSDQNKYEIISLNNNQQALLLSTNSQIISNSPSKIVLIENESLLKFFNMLKYYLTKRGYFYLNNHKTQYNLLFFLAKLSDKNNISVSRLINRYIDLDKSNQMYCLIENTYKFIDLKCDKTNVHHLMRHSLENYIYDPLNIFLYLFLKSPKELAMFESYINDYFVTSLYDLFQLRKESMICLIQTIVDHFSDTFIKEFMASKIASSFNLNEKLKIKFVYDIEYFKNKDNNSCFYIIYPKFFIQMRGQYIKNIFLKLFPCLPQDLNIFIEFLRNEIFENPKLKHDKFLSMANYYRFLPYDLIQNFKNIQDESYKNRRLMALNKIQKFETNIYNEKNTSSAIEFLNEEFKKMRIDNMNHILSIIDQFNSNLNTLFNSILNHLKKYDHKEEEMNRSIRDVLNQNITDFEKMDKVISILDKFSKLTKNSNEPSMIFNCPMDVYNYLYGLAHFLDIYNEEKLSKIHELNEHNIWEFIIDIIKSLNEIFIEKAIYSNLKKSNKSIDYINHTLQIQKLYALIKNMNISLKEKLNRILFLVDYSAKYYKSNDIFSTSNENLVFNIINVFIELKNNGFIYENDSFIKKLINQVELDMLDNSFNYNNLLQCLVNKFNSKLEVFLLKFLRRISIKINKSLIDFFDENGKLKSKLLVFKLIKSEEIDLIEIDYPLLMLNCSSVDLKFIYQVIFEHDYEPDYQKLSELNQSFQHEFKDDIIFKKLLYPSFLIDKYNYIDNEINLLELFNSVRLSYNFKDNGDLFFNQDVKRFLYNPINIFFYIYHKNSKGKLDMKDFYKTVEHKILCENKYDNLTFKTRFQIREIALNYILQKFVKNRIIRELQQYMIDEFIVKKNMDHIGIKTRQNITKLIEKMRKMNLILNDFTIDTIKTTQVTLKIDDSSQENELKLRYEYPSIFLKLDSNDLKSIYEFIAPPYSFEPKDITRFLRNENNLNELILVHYYDE